MASQAAPFQVLTEDNHGPLITLVSVSFLIAAIVFVAAKLGSVLYFKQRRRTAVNTPIWAALILAIIEVVLLQKAVDNGVGQHVYHITVAARDRANKYTYAAQLIQVIVLSLSKLSTTLLVWHLTPNNNIRLACKITIAITAAWTLFAFFGTAFQCAMPQPWLYLPDRCIGKGAVLYPIAILHILTEVIIIVMPFFMMRNVQMKTNKRVKILSSFSARSLVVALAIAYLTFLPTYLQTSDPTWDLVYPAICSQAMMCTSITVACFPTLYHIFAGLHSGLMTTQLPAGVGVELTRPSCGGSSAYIRKSTLSVSRSRLSEKERRLQGLYSDTTHLGNAKSLMVTDITTTGYNDGTTARDSSGSEGGETESTRRLNLEPHAGGVMKTVDITVEVERQSDGGGYSVHY